jgi:hypothetical protein
VVDFAILGVTEMFQQSAGEAVCLRWSSGSVTQRDRQMVEDIQPPESDQRSLEEQRAVEQLVRAFQDVVVPTQQSLDTMMDRAYTFRGVRWSVL